MSTTLIALQTALDVLKLLADETRWQLLQTLRTSDYQVGELVDQLRQPQNLVSYHLGLLRQAGLVQMHRSEADARVLYYGLDATAVEQAFKRIEVGLQLADQPALATMPRPLVVFLCTGNSARSQMAEGWLRQLSGGRVPVRSAGTQPRNLHPLAVQVMAEAGVDIGYQHAKAVSELLPAQAQIIVTVCDRAREEPPNLNAPVQLHWSIADPVRIVDAEDPAAPFRAARDELRSRVQALLAALPTMTLPPISKPE